MKPSQYIFLLLLPFKCIANILLPATNRIAPEVALGEPYDKSADVFSYAMVLLELVLEKLPPRRTHKFTFDLVAVDKVKPKDTPFELWNLCCMCASAEPMDRPKFDDIVELLLAMRDVMNIFDDHHMFVSRHQLSSSDYNSNTMQEGGSVRTYYKQQITTVE